MTRPSRLYLQHGYYVTVSPSGEALPTGGAIAIARVVDLRRRAGFTAQLFADRSFLLDELIVGGHYLHELRRVASTLDRRREVVVVDAGANVGLFPLFARAFFRQIKVIGFEPLDDNRILCGRNWAGIEHELRPEVLLDVAAAAVPFYYAGSTTGATTVPAEAEHQAARRATPISERDVPATTLDAIELDRVDVLKLDIEGAEERALAGATATIAAHRPIILCSVEHDSNSSELIEAIVTEAAPYTVRRDPQRQLLTFYPTPFPAV